jgi:hypothetical protein
MARKKTPKPQEEEEEEASTSSSEHEAMDEQVSDDDEEEEEEEESSEEEEASTSSSEEASPANYNPSGESCSFALPDLVSFNTHQMNPAKLYNKPSSNSDYGSCTIASSLVVNEDVLMNKAIGGARQLLTELWKLDSERVEGGFVMARLPSRSGRDCYVFPRMLVSVFFAAATAAAPSSLARHQY